MNSVGFDVSGLQVCVGVAASGLRRCRALGLGAVCAVRVGPFVCRRCWRSMLELWVLRLSVLELSVAVIVIAAIGVEAAIGVGAKGAVGVEVAIDVEAAVGVGAMGMVGVGSVGVVLSSYWCRWFWGTECGRCWSSGFRAASV
jgi:hypothetical protein